LNSLLIQIQIITFGIFEKVLALFYSFFLKIARYYLQKRVLKYNQKRLFYAIVIDDEVLSVEEISKEKTKTKK